MKNKIIADSQSNPVAVLHEILYPQETTRHSHDFYELIYMAAGRGVHTNQDIQTEFTEGDLFLVKSHEIHSYQIATLTEVYIVRFTEQARLLLKELVNHSSEKAVALSKAKSPLNLKVTFKEADDILVRQLFGVLLTLDKESHKNENLFYYQLLCLITVIERNLNYFHRKDQVVSGKENIGKILGHIHKNLRDPEVLSLDYIAAKFGISNNSLGSHFKIETGQSVKQYINECRLQLIGDKVAKSEMSFSQIAHQFGFVDESHFYKSFKKFYQTSPSVYRKRFLIKQIVVK